MAVALEGVLGILLVKLLPLSDQVRMQLVFTGGLGDGLACLDFTQNLRLKLFGKDTAFEAHSRWSLFRSIPP